MQLLAVELADFRNLVSALVEPHPRFNVLSGDNGQGKTNFLEAVFLLGTLRPLRAGRLEELVRFGTANARAAARVERAQLERRFEVEVWADPPRKLARVDGKAVRAAAEYFGGFNVVLFVPEDLRLPRGAPAARRRFLDRAVWNVRPAFLKEAQIYERTLRSRNALLRAGALAASDELLAVFDEQLAAAGAVIVSHRLEYLAELSAGVARAFHRITRSELSVEMRYESSLGDDTGADSAVTPERLRRALRESQARDRAAGYTSRGPHADDLAFHLGGRPARSYASQGQLRALVLALKIAEITHLAATLGEPPILLLDDVSSELDPARTRLLFDFLAELQGQVFITTTDPRHVLIEDARLDFRVSAGQIVRLPRASPTPPDRPVTAPPHSPKVQSH